jgi:hypothetical protein
VAAHARRRRRRRRRRQLKTEFGRDVVFEYECAGAVVRVETQADLDAAIEAADRAGHQLDVLVRKARWSSTTEFYASQPAGTGFARRPWYLGDL